jgi:capsular exopolysaccharide synthesis family protein
MSLGLDISTTSFKNHYTAIPQTNTQFMEIIVKWGSQEEARAIIDTLNEVFIEEALRIYPTYTIKILEKIEPQLVEQIGDKIYYLLALSVGLFLSFVAVLILFYFDNTLESEDDVEKYLKIPVIGTIPKFTRKQGRFLESIQNKKGVSLDAYRTLRTNLYYISKDINMKSIVITSASPKEGKSTASLMLAAVLAQGGKRTLLVDCDLRKPSLHKILNMEDKGLSNILMDEYEWTDVVRESKIDNLFALPAGSKPADPTSLISSDRMMDLIGTLKEAFDFVVIDTPPVALVTDAQILSQCTEGYLIVVSSGKSDINCTNKALKLIQYAQGRVVGVLLNKVADLKIYRKYGYYYR